MRNKLLCVCTSCVLKSERLLLLVVVVLKSQITATTTATLLLQYCARGPIVLTESFEAVDRGLGEIDDDAQYTRENTSALSQSDQESSSLSKLGVFFTNRSKTPIRCVLKHPIKTGSYVGVGVCMYDWFRSRSTYNNSTTAFLETDFR